MRILFVGLPSVRAASRSGGSIDSGLELVHAADAEEALALARGRAFDLVHWGDSTPGLDTFSEALGGEEPPLIRHPGPLAAESGPVSMEQRQASEATEYRRVEQALLDGEQRFRTVANYTHDWEYWTAPDGRVLWMSPSCERVTGYPVEAFLQDPELIFRICQPEERARFRDHMREATEGRDLAPVEFRIQHRDGGLIWISHICVPVWDDQGRPAGRRATNIDVTERKLADLVLLESEQRFRTVFDKAIDGIVIFSIEGEIIDVNEAFAAMHGRTREELRGLHLGDCDAPESARLAPGRMRRLLSGETLKVDLEQVHKDGHVFQTEATATLVSLGGRPAILSFHRDITDRKRAEEALQRERILKSAIVDSTDDAIITKSLDGVITSWNQGAEKLLGYSAEDMLGQSVLTIIPADRVAEEAEVLAHIRRGEPLQHYETVRKAKDGRLVPISLTVSPIRNLEGRVVGASKIARDITELKKLEGDIQALNRDLEHHVEVRTRQLEAANQELEAFTYSVSHDLRAPLRHLTGFVELLNRRGVSALDAKSRHYLEVISQSASKMGCLIDDLLSFSRMGRAELMKQTVDLGQLTQEVRDEVAKDLPPGRDIQWRIGRLPVVTGDQAMLRLVLVNLLSNAVKYSKHGESPVIELGAWMSGETEWTVFVRDHGAGFEMKYVDKLFGLFQRLHSSEEYEGTGVGLANVRRIITRHGGRTWAEGELNKGATFYFTLPLQKET
jgi:PAS domain S-box-containing protein